MFEIPVGAEISMTVFPGDLNSTDLYIDGTAAFFAYIDSRTAPLDFVKDCALDFALISPSIFATPDDWMDVCSVAVAASLPAGSVAVSGIKRMVAAHPVYPRLAPSRSRR